MRGGRFPGRPGDALSSPATHACPLGFRPPLSSGTWQRPEGCKVVAGRPPPEPLPFEGAYACDVRLVRDPARSNIRPREEETTPHERGCGWRRAGYQTLAPSRPRLYGYPAPHRASTTYDPGMGHSGVVAPRGGDMIVRSCISCAQAPRPRLTRGPNSAPPPLDRREGSQRAPCMRLARVS
jgi:hypothetical protein